MPSVGFIVADYVCPTIGAIMSTLTFAAPIKSLKTAMKSGALGSLNPTPWAFMTGNTIGWLAYSYITLDLFVFFANAPGLIISIWLNVGALKLQYYEEIIKYSSIQLAEGRDSENNDAGEDETQQSADEDEGDINNTGDVCPRPPPSLTPHESKMIQIILIWLGILSVTNLMQIGKEDMKFVIGVAVNINLIFFYGAPLSTIMTVIRSKSSESIHGWTMVMNTSNAFFWCIYSLAIRDYYILIPNGLGFMFGIVQIILYNIYPRSEIVGGDGIGQSDSQANSAESENEII